MGEDIDYAEAKRRARTLLGAQADAVKQEKQPFPARIGVWAPGFIMVGAGNTWLEALDEVKARMQKLEKEE